jgi:hypothetical protein
MSIQGDGGDFAAFVMAAASEGTCSDLLLKSGHSRVNDGRFVHVGLTRGANGLAMARIAWELCAGS